MNIRQMLSLFLAGSMVVWAQPPAGQPPVGQTPPPAGPAQAQIPSAIPEGALRLRPNYTLQIGDQVLVRAQNIEEVGDRPFRVQEDGTILLPVPQINPVRAAGRTVEEFEAALVEELKRFFREPRVTVTVVAFSAPPVFLIGAFRNPGIKPLAGRATLVELLTREGGLAANASRRIRVTRRKESGPIPLKGAVDTADGKGSYVEINIEKLQTAINPEEDIVLEPLDVISVERAEQIYFLGGFGRNGPIELGERRSMSMLQALAMAGGVQLDVNPRKAYILRPIGNTSQRAQIPIDLSKVMRGEVNDFPLQPNDVVYVPVPGLFPARQILPQFTTGIASGLITALIFRTIQRR
jgi:polysaccharide export outer membrane protein